MLQPKYAKQLDSNIKELIANGGSNDDVDKMASDYTALFSNDALKKKEKSTGTGPAKQLASEATTGSSDGASSKGFPKIDTNSVAPGMGAQPKAESSAAKEKRLRQKLANVKVTPENMDAVMAETDALSSSIKTNEKAKAQVKSQRVKELETSFYSATQDNDDDAVAEQRLNDAVNTNGVWNNVKSIAKKAVNTVIDGAVIASKNVGLLEFKINEDPLSGEKETVKKAALKNKEQLSEAEVNQRAKELFKEKEKENLFLDRANSFLDNMDTEDKNLLKQDRYDKSIHLQEDNVKRLKYNAALQTVAEDKIEDYKAVESQLQQLKESGQSFPEELYNKYTSLGAEIKQLGATLSKNEQYVLNNKKDLGTAQQEFDLFKRESGDFNNFAGNITVTTGEIATGILGSINYFASMSGNPMDRIGAMQGQEVASQFAADLKGARENLRKPVESLESAEGFLNYTSDLLANQIPILLATSTGAGGLAAVGMSSTGQKYTEMNDEVRQGKASYTPLQMAVSPFLYGGAEVISEIPTLSILKKGGRVIESIARNEAELITRTATQKAVEWSKDYGIDMGKEMAGEQFTNFTQNFNDKYILGKKDVGLLDNTGTVFKDTFTLTSILKVAPHVFGVIAKPFQSKTDLGTLDENSRKIIEFSKQLNTAGLSDVEKTVIQKQIDKATTESSKIVANTIGKITDMPGELYDEAISLNSKAGEIKSQARAINDGNLPNKEALLKGLSEDYKALQEKRNGIIEGKTTVVDVLPLQEQETLKKQAMKDLVNELNPDGSKDITITNEQVVERANKIYAESKANENPAVNENLLPTVPADYNIVDPPTQNAPQAEAPAPEAKQEVAKDYKIGADMDIPTMTVVENGGEFLIGNLTPQSEGVNPSLKAITDLDENTLRFKTKEEAEAKLKEIQNPPVVKQTTPDTKAQPTEVEVAPSVSINEAVKDDIGVYYYDGEKGTVRLDGQQIVFETKDKIIELGNKDELSESNLEDLGIEKESELSIQLNDDNSVVINGKKYNNNYSNPEAAINIDKDGNYSVTLETENGQKRTFRGQQAEQIVYQTKLKNFEQNATEQQIEAAHTAADEAIRIEGEVTNTSVKRENKSVRKAKQRTLKKIKQPSSKNEAAPIVADKKNNDKGKLEGKTYTTKKGDVYEIEIFDGANGVVKNFEDRKNKDRASLSARDKNGKQIGLVVFWKDEDGKFFANITDVKEANRREGIATALYEYAKSTGIEIKPSKTQTEMGAEFSKKIKYSNETASPTNTPVDGNLPTGADNVGENGNAKPESPAKESVPGAADAGENKGTDVVKKTVKYKSWGKETEFTVETDSKGEVKIFKKDGTEVPKYSKRALKKKVNNKIVYKTGRNPQYSKILAIAEGRLTNNEINKDVRKQIQESIDNFIPTNEYEYALLAIARGIKFSKESIQREVGNLDSKWATDQFTTKKLPSIVNVAEDIVANADFVELDEEILVSHLIDIIAGFGSINDVKESLHEMYQRSIDPFYGMNEADAIEANKEFITEAEQTLFEAVQAEDNLNESEKLKYYQNEYEKSIESLTGEQQRELYDQHESDRQGLPDPNEGDAISDSEEVRGGQEKGKEINAESPELKEVNAKLAQANENLRIAKEALDRKAKLLDKELLKDNEDIFGERPNQNENKLFDERVDVDARNKATAKERQAIKDAQAEIKQLTELKAKIESGEVVSTKEINFEIDDKSTPDQILEWLENAEKELNDFGRDNLSVGIPIVVAKAAIQAMKIAVKAGKLAAEIIQAGLDAVKQSDWFKNLTQTEQVDIENDFQTNFLNKISAIDPANERQAENLLNRAASENISEEDAFNEIREDNKKSREQIANRKTLKEVFKNAYRTYIKRATDKQYIAKMLLNKSGMKAVQNLIINAHGASAAAKMQFEEAYEKIYKYKVTVKVKGGLKVSYEALSTKDRNDLDEIIQAKRFIAIDTNREARGLDPITHPNFNNKDKSEKFLSGLRKELGDEKYNDLVRRADLYFETYKSLLKNVYENGLISKASYDSMSDIDYQPRVFLQFVTNFNGDLQSNKRSNNIDSGGLSADQIKNLKEGDANSLVLNSEFLLMNSLSSRSKAMAMNNVNKRFMTGEFQKAKARFDKLDPKNLKGDDVRFYKYFKELSSKVIDNPIIGSAFDSITDKQKKFFDETEAFINQGLTISDDARAKYEKLLDLKNDTKNLYDKTPANFSKNYYYVDGQRYEFFLEDELHESWNDNVEGFMTGNAKEIASYVFGSALLKAIATGNNPAFPIVNTPRDLLFTLTFSDQYSNILPKAMFQIGKDVAKAIKEIRKPQSDVLKKYIEYGGGMDFLSSQGKLKKNTLLGKAMEGLVSANARDISKTAFSAATFSKISQYSEMMFRLGIFQRTIQNQLKDLGFSDISEVTDKQQVDDIYNQAVTSARSILDFNQGGSITKDMEAFIPYINVAFQGGRVAATAFEKDPVNTTVKVLQVATLASVVPIGISLALISAMKSDDDEDKTTHEIYLDAIAGISKYQKEKYMNIPTPFKNEEGQYLVIKIAKAQELAPVMLLTDNIFNNMIRSMAGQEKKSAAQITAEGLTAFNHIMPVDVTSPSGFFTRSPAIKATMTYATGYDFFKDEPLSFDIGKVPLPVEGITLSSTEDFYKKIGENFGFSPVRTKGFVESFITSPGTNPFVGMLYGGADAASSDKGMKQIGGELVKTTLKSFTKRTHSYTSDFNRQLAGKKEMQEKLDAINIEKHRTKAEFNTLTKQFVNKEISKADLDSKMGELEPIEKKRMYNKIKDKIRLKDVDGTILDIKYEQGNEAKALMIMHYYGDIFDGSKDSRAVMIQMKKAKGILTPATMQAYNKLKKELATKKRPE